MVFSYLVDDPETQLEVLSTVSLTVHATAILRCSSQFAQGYCGYDYSEYEQ